MTTDFLTNTEMASLVEAIQKAEEHSSGEIRVHIDTHSEKDLAKEAIDAFHKLEMQKTQYRNAVLFYISFEQKYLTIIGDKGIHEKVQQHFWDQLHDEITQKFAQKLYFQGLRDALLKTGMELKKHFPVDQENKNELPNEISFS
ncbi:TPM domain-containing protein [Elizabethkingia anophelis]|uniref:TPM domain-containing protein n=1 Tax=Elizabethkingia anophelis TaxID=1117645 RepID=A0AAP7RJN9_9FLAO|nr:TPM domain-containing protein [Elizabethkingia anophelis]AQW94432.1 hypothetical protein BBD30_09630 [Elizabethkingia anophelis]AQX00798.1 hypothetical protein BBD32_04635 [Elizabethkingia anophelis]EJC8061753.1 TPM domain-containing protein [Elizabethkingia anophelis]KFC39722.1 membrane protein [Elizabethkingia anophelis]KGT08897.1 membrane protein [Elizabethkingia anophelis]